MRDIRTPTRRLPAALIVLVLIAVFAAVFVSGAVALGAQEDERRLPPVGVAVEVAEGYWCVQLPAYSGESALAGAPVAVVFPDGRESLVWTARVSERVRGARRTAFPQPRWERYAAHRLEGASGPAPARKVVGLAVASTAPWRRMPSGTLRADLDGDGLPEEARRCAADEGEHFTIWSIGADGSATRRAHEYFDWGGIVEPTCAPGEDGR